MSVFVPLMVAAVAYWSTASNQAAQSTRNFELEAARIVLGAESPAAAFHKASMLKALFPDKLSPEFATRFEPSAFETYSSAGSKREVLNLMLAHPGEEAQIVAWWARLFPADAEGEFAFLPALAEGALTPAERAKLLDSIREQLDR